MGITRQEGCEEEKDCNGVVVQVLSESLVMDRVAGGLVGGACVLFAVSRSEGHSSRGLRGTTAAGRH